MASTRPAAAPPSRGGWRRWLVIVLAFNIALGMGFSVVLLRHQVDDQARAAELFAQLDAAVSRDQAAGYAAPGTALTAPAALASLVGATGTEDDDLRAVRAAVAAFVAAVGTGDPAALTVAADGARAEVATALDAHRAETTDLGRVADFETVFMMVFAAGTAGLLFRRFEAARRTGELRVVAAKARSEARFRALVHNSSDVITLAGPDLSVRFQTPSVERVLGWRAEELAGTSLVDLVHPEDRLTLLDAQAEAVSGAGGDVVSEVRVRDRDGAWRHVHSVHTNLLADPSVAAVVVTTRDVTAQKQLEQQLQHNAFHDALTGLANRALFADRLGHALARTDRGSSSLAVLLVDLDDFKSVNDSAGHAAGDRLLQAVGDRLRTQLRPGDTIARLGGDEFAVLLEDADGATATVAAARVQDALAGLATEDGGTGVAASIGIAVGAAGQHDAAELLRSADVAMYAAKQAGKGRSAVFEPDMDAAVIGQLQLKAELTRALADSELVVHYQPVVQLATGALSGVEALVRWEHPERGLVPPAEFVPLAEQSGLVVPLGRYVLTEACRQMRSWHDRHPGARHLTVSVNLSARELEEPGLVESVRSALRVTGLDPARLVLEITETLLLVDLPRTVAVLTELRALGLRLAIDDFGTGYSSLAYLEQLPVQVLKIDKSFVDRIAETSPDADGRPTSVMVAAISQLGHTLDLQMVAEGVEHPEQAHALRALGCQFGQGYVFARPLPAAELGGLLLAGTGWAHLVGEPVPA